MGIVHTSPSETARSARYYEMDRASDQRNPFQRDRDRILYTSSFRRLAWVTQVVSSWEGEPFHNRLTHTLEVAQIGRRLAEHLATSYCKEAQEIGGVDADVVEAAALAHDLGHPPFGHTAERALDSLMQKAEVHDGFEGNAQTFRVLTKLAIRNPAFPGLNLCRATLDAVLKYPWHRQSYPERRHQKWGAYNSESTEFEWVRGPEPRDSRKSAEAELMDFADDIAYAVHDVEDFYRAGLIPLDRLVRHDDEVDKFLDGTFVSLSKNSQSVPYTKSDCKIAFREILETLPIREPYEGNSQQRASLRSLTAGLINRYFHAIKLNVPGDQHDRFVAIDSQAELEIFVFKQLTWHYVIDNVALASQQYGQRQIISQLFHVFQDAAESGHFDIFPPSYRELMERSRDEPIELQLRFVADLLSGMTEQQAMAMHQRFTGNSLGTVMNSIVQ